MAKVLFIGNSHTYFHDMPHLFALYARTYGVDVQVAMLTKGGMGLDYHAGEEQTRFNILYGGYEAVVLQHVAHPMGSIQAMFAGAETIQRWIDEAGAKTVLFETWAKKDEPEKQAAMTQAYRELAQKLPAALAPVGEVWQAHRQAHPEIELYDQDGAHASQAGSELIARVIGDAIFAPGGVLAGAGSKGAHE